MHARLAKLSFGLRREKRVFSRPYDDDKPKGDTPPFTPKLLVRALAMFIMSPSDKAEGRYCGFSSFEFFPFSETVSGVALSSLKVCFSPVQETVVRPVRTTIADRPSLPRSAYDPT